MWLQVGALTQDIDDAIREFIVANGAYACRAVRLWQCFCVS